MQINAIYLFSGGFSNASLHAASLHAATSISVAE